MAEEKINFLLDDIKEQLHIIEKYIKKDYNIVVNNKLNSAEYYIQKLLDTNNTELREGDNFKIDKKQRKYITNRNLFHNYECFCSDERISKIFNHQTFIKIVNKKIKQTTKKINGKTVRVYYID
jgi:hypothetical protein